jgi:site-specific DNA-cytosine methylase
MREPSKPLKSIDLFTGTGALTLALKGVAEPMLYCDVDASSRALIAHKQTTGDLPVAPIHDDIRSLKPPRADMVIGGFPCVGFSPRGKREHFGNHQSSLFYEMMRIVEESGAHAVFMENVPGVVAEIDAIKDTLGGMGFSMRWTVVGADDVGAPHVRKRWFCIAYKPTSALLALEIDVAGETYTPFDWSASAAPPRTRRLATREDVRASDARWALLGNGVVPDAVRLGFFRLFTAGRVRQLEDGNVSFVREDQVASSSVPSSRNAKRCDIPHVDTSGQQTLLSSEPIIVPSTWNACIVLDPSALPPPDKPSPNQSTATLQCILNLNRWSTPRHGMTRPCRVLTDRSSRDLPTQIVFEATTENRSHAVNADFCDWVMGLRPGYTYCPGVTPTRPRPPSKRANVPTTPAYRAPCACATTVTLPDGFDRFTPLVFICHAFA